MARKLARSCKKRSEGAYYDPESSSSSNSEDDEEALPPPTRRPPAKNGAKKRVNSESSDSCTEDEAPPKVKPKRGRPPKKRKPEIVPEVVVPAASLSQRQATNGTSNAAKKEEKEGSEEHQMETETETSRSPTSSTAASEPEVKKPLARPRGRPPKIREQPVAETDHYLLKKALLLYEYINLDSGQGKQNVYKPFLARSLTYLDRKDPPKKARKNLMEVINNIRAIKHIPSPTKKAASFLVKKEIKKEGPEEAEEPTGFGDNPAVSVLFCTLRHPSFVGYPKADIQVYVCAESDGKFGDVERVPSSNFGMLINEKAGATCIDMPLEVGNVLPKNVQARAHYLVVKVIFHQMSGTLSTGKSLRNTASRHAPPQKSTSMHGSKRDVWIGACCLVEVTKQDGTRWGTEKGIVLVEANRVNAATGTEWCRDRTFVRKTMELGKKSNTNPFLLVDFVEDQDNSDSDSEVDGRSFSNSWNERKHTPTKKEQPKECGFVAMKQRQEMSLHIPNSLLYNFVSKEDEKRPENREFSDQTLGEVVDKATAKRGLKLDLRPDQEHTVTRVVPQADRCIFCDTQFKDLFVLMMHLRYSYPRLEFIYKGLDNILQVPLIDVSLNPNFDASNETCATAYNTKGVLQPRKLTTSDPIYLVTRCDKQKRRSLKRSLELFQTEAEMEKRLQEFKQPVFFNPRSLHPFYVPGEEAKRKNNDQEWRKRCLRTKFDDFVDLDPKEKEFMQMWGVFCLKDEYRPKWRGAFYKACRQFLVLHQAEMVEKDLEIQWMSHVTIYKDLDCLDENQTYDLIQRFYDDSYEPTDDPLHFVSREKEARRIAESKRLKDKDLNAKKERRSHSHSPSKFTLRQNSKRAELQSNSSANSRQSSVAPSTRPENPQGVQKRGRLKPYSV
ncbi:hypothetical protein L596_025211 [Steinernema carpocapsae]|uniref:Polycomb protein VEFS-Box domain-containing protein n=1 Tax=Steinernema carpocapsae TaxID=34508 RepID=A0A4U5M742_STECR|nr:hypothetical protein L596_025211 [Steinernema carpocapsae]